MMRGNFQNGRVIWITGPQFAGKTTLAVKLWSLIPNAVLLDGGEIRDAFPGLGFSATDRNKQVARIIWLAQKIVAADGNVIAAFVSPYDKARKIARTAFAKFTLIYVRTPHDIRVARDNLGIYADGSAGPYEVPEDADIIVEGY